MQVQNNKEEVPFAHYEEKFASLDPQEAAMRCGVPFESGRFTVTLLGTALLLFTGSMEASCGDTALTIHATWWADLSLSYSEIDTIEYRSNLDTGMRTNGFGSARFSLGTFCNDEFGSYTLYAYTKASEFVVLTADGKTLVIGMDEPERTREIYDELIARIHR